MAKTRNPQATIYCHLNAISLAPALAQLVGKFASLNDFRLSFSLFISITFSLFLALFLCMWA